MTERALVRRTACLVTGLLLATGLTGCTNTESSYCSSLEDHEKELTRLSAASGKPGRAGAAALAETADVLSGLRDDAPDDIADEWDTLVEALQGLLTAIEDSGATPSDFAGGTKPDGVTTGQYSAVQRAGEELRSTRVQQAGVSIEQHAHDVCKVDLGTGLGGVR